LICQDTRRDKNTICVVEEPLDIIAVEKTGYNGMYHVLGGVISPIDGIGPEDLRINQLIVTIENNSNIQEIILATDPSLEGEATSMYITERIKQLQQDKKINKNIKITRLARGLPVGGDLEYADEVTLKRALEGRSEII
jgi:recombination protein RecR